MIPIGDMTLIELAAFVQSHLREKGIDVILSDLPTCFLISWQVQEYGL
jgi:hypothetical protein